METYTDSFGRIHHKLATETNPYPSNNSFLYSGEASLLGVPVDKIGIERAWDICQTDFGYNRNPDNHTFPLSSHDEVVGMFMLTDQAWARSYFEILCQQHFQVCNLQTFTPTPLHKLNPFKVVSDFRKLSREENPRTSTFKYPYIAPVVFRHMPQHTFFYARCAGIVPGFIHSAYHFCSSLHTIYRGTNSSRVLLGFKLLKYKKLKQTFSEKIITQLYNMHLRFEVEVAEYFPKDHPIVEAALYKKGVGI